MDTFNYVRFVIAAILLLVALTFVLIAKRKEDTFWYELAQQGGRANGAELEKAATLKCFAVCLAVAAAVFGWPEDLSFR